MTNDQNNTPPRPPQSGIGLGGDAPVQNLAGIAPAVVDAFLNANAKKKAAAAPPPSAVTAPEPVSPRSPASLGAFPAMDGEALKQRQMKIRHLALMFKEQPAAPQAPEAPPTEDGPPPAPPAPPTSPAPPGPPAPPAASAGPADDMRAKHLAMRKPAPGTGRLNPGTGRLPAPPQRGTGQLSPLPPEGPGRPPVAPGDIRLQHLALRQQQQQQAQPVRGTGRLDPAEAGGARLERMVEAALGIDGAIALRQTIEALDDKGMSTKLSALTDRVTELVPGHEGMAKLGVDVGKRMLVNNLNPVLALTVAAKESAEKIDTLKKWNELSTKERMAATAGLSANLAEILGAVTPPPVNFGAQIAAAGLTLVSLATDHSDAIEDVATKAATSESGRKVASELSERGAVVAHQVKMAWEELGERIKTGKKLKPRAPQQLQNLFDSPRFKKMKKNPTTRALAEGFENLTYNLTKKWDAQKASWAHRFRRGD